MRWKGVVKSFFFSWKVLCYVCARHRVNEKFKFICSCCCFQWARKTVRSSAFMILSGVWMLSCRFSVRNNSSEGRRRQTWSATGERLRVYKLWKKLPTNVVECQETFGQRFELTKDTNEREKLLLFFPFPIIRFFLHFCASVSATPTLALPSWRAPAENGDNKKLKFDVFTMAQVHTIIDIWTAMKFSINWILRVTLLPLLIRAEKRTIKRTN